VTELRRAFAYFVHLGLGAAWLLSLYFALAEGGATTAWVWTLAASALWLLDAARMADTPEPWRVTFLWWATTFIAPLVLVFRAYRAYTNTTDEPITEVELSTDELRRRLTVAETTLAALQTEVADLRALVGHAAATPAPPRPAPAAPRQVVTPPPAAPPRQEALTPPRRPYYVDHAFDFSALIGPKAFAIAGGIVTLLGVVFFFVLAANRGWIGPELRVALGAAASAAVFAGGFWLRRRYPESYSSLAAVGAGLAGGYVTLAAATVLYGLLPSPLALPVAAALAAVGVGVAIAWSAQLLAGIGVLGAIAAPALLALDEGISAAGTAFVAIMFAAAVVVAVRKVWPELLLAASAAAVPQALWLALATEGWDTVVVCFAIAALLLAAGIAYELRGELPHRVSGVGYALASATLAGVCARLLFERGDELGSALVIVGFAYAAVAVALFVRGRLVDFSSLLGALALTFGAVAAAELLSGQSLAIAWALQAIVLAWLARAIDEPRYQLGALAYAGLSLGHVLAIDAPFRDLFVAHEHPATGAPSVLVLAVALAVVAWFAAPWESDARERRLVAIDNAVRGAQEHVRLTVAALGALLGVYAVSLGILEVAQTFASSDPGEIRPAFEWGHVAVTSIAALVAYAVFFVPSTIVRSGAFAGLSLVLVKYLFFDIDALHGTREGWAALALGAAVFGVSVLAHHVAPRAAERDPVPLLAAPIAAALGTYAATILVEPEGLGLLAVAVPFAVAGAIDLRRVRDYASVLLGIACVLAGAASALLLSDTWLVLAYAALAAGLAALTTATRESRFSVAGHAFAALAVLHALAFEAPPLDLFVSDRNPGDGVPAVLLAALAALAVALVARRYDRRVAEAGTWLAGALGVYALSLALLQGTQWLSGASVDTDFQRGHVAVSASWAIVGLLVLYGGLRRQSTRLRLAGVGLFGISLAKLFLYDLAFLTSITRAFSFLAVGALMLLAGFFYERLVRPRDIEPA
jgi:uncharacterized membrane protein